MAPLSYNHSSLKLNKNYFYPKTTKYPQVVDLHPFKPWTFNLINLSQQLLQYYNQANKGAMKHEKQNPNLPKLDPKPHLTPQCWITIAEYHYMPKFAIINSYGDWDMIASWSCVVDPVVACGWVKWLIC